MIAAFELIGPPSSTVRRDDLAVDLSHLSEEERALIQNVMAKAKEIEEPPPSHIPSEGVLEPKSTLEVRDLDEHTTEAEVDNAVKSVLGDAIEVKAFVSKTNSRERR
ncbi:hypothetical protein J6590_038415 [Homalodisca vitripennis]|nr:hypothetical protein J6590_038415 [Homalodisca vitripennis]